MNQLRVVHALALRETRTRFGKHKLGYLWALIEPTIWILTFRILFDVIDRDAPYGMDIFPFLVTGVVPYSMFVKTSDRVMLSVSGNKALLVYPQVQTLDLVFARSGLEMATFGAVFVVLMGTNALFTQALTIDNALLAAWGLFLAGMLGTSLGVLLCSLDVLSNTVQRVKGPAMRPLFWISGLFFTANGLPSNVREILLWNPLLHCVEVTRTGWFTTYEAHHASVAYVLGWIIAFAFAGMTLERAVRKKVTLS